MLLTHQLQPVFIFALADATNFRDRNVPVKAGRTIYCDAIPGPVAFLAVDTAPPTKRFLTVPKGSFLHVHAWDTNFFPVRER